MTRIFLTLAGLSLLLLCTNIVLGSRIGDYNGQVAAMKQAESEIAQLRYDERIETLKRQRPRPLDEITRLQEEQTHKLKQVESQFAPIKNRAFVHQWFGVIAALVTLLVNSISVTYFIGTSRWVREVVETYGFSTDLIVESNVIKRSTFPWALIGMLTVLGIIALGQAANPGIARAGTDFWVTPHMLGAMLGTAIIGYAFYRQGSNIAKNYALIGRIVLQVEEVRRARGLDADDAAHDAPLRPEYEEPAVK